MDELNATSNRQARVTKRTQLARMLECIHGMRPEYAEKLANQFGTFRIDFEIHISVQAFDGFQKVKKSNMKKCLIRGEPIQTELPNSLKKAILIFFKNI